MHLLVSEIFSSLQGESKFAGFPTTFVRLYGCNMLCTFCDSMYAVNGKKFKRTSIDVILSTVKSMGNKHVCVTGGEPLLQENTFPLLYEFVERGHIVTIETNGGIELDLDTRRKFMYIMDVKTPSSGMTGKNILKNLKVLTAKDEVKFVIADREDYEYALGVLKQYRVTMPVIFSPCFTPENKSRIMLDLSNWIIEDKPVNVRLGVQIHKIIGLA
jgi:7-carboxy-7-deazaguanine synthase